MKKLILAFATVLLLTNCKKNDFSSELPQKNENTSYLKVSAKEYKRLMNEVPFMSGIEYSEWKKKQGSFYSLYDRFTEVNNRISSLTDSTQIKQILADESNFFFLDSEGNLNIRAGLIARILDQNGVIEVSNGVNKFIGGDLYYAKVGTDDASLLVKSNNIDIIKAKTSIGVLSNKSISHINKIPETHSRNLFSKTGIDNMVAAAKQVQLNPPSYYPSVPPGMTATKGWKYFEGRGESNKRKIFVTVIYQLDVIAGYDLATGHRFWIDPTQRTYIVMTHSRKTIIGWNAYDTEATLEQLSYNLEGIGSFTLPAAIFFPGNQYSQSYSILTEPAIINTNNVLSGYSRTFSSFYIKASNRGGAVASFSASGDASIEL